MRRLAVGMWAAQSIAALAMLLAAAIEVESILVAGPLLTIIGLVNAMLMARLASWQALLVSISAPLICALVALSILAFDWSPDEARGPVVRIMATYLLVFVALVVATWKTTFAWATRDTTLDVPAWQFSLKSLLVVMTAVCLTIAIGRLVVANRLPRGEDWIFGGFTVVAIGLSAVIAWRFAFYRRTIAVVPQEEDETLRTGPQAPGR